MNDYTPSDAAKDYVGGMFDEPSAWAPIIVTAFDAGIAHERESRKPRTIGTTREFEAAPDGTAGQSPKTRNIFVKCDGLWYLTGASEPLKSREVPAFGPLTLLVPASESAPEPVRLTDADDERIKPGARVRYIKDLTVADRDCWTDDEVGERFIERLLDRADSVLLLAEAPEQDADLIDAMPKNLTAGWDRGAWIDVLDKVRSAGYDITKRADQ